VHDVYKSTAQYFSDLQSKAWPRVRQFLQDQKPGSLIADIGNLGLCRVVWNIFHHACPFHLFLSLFFSKQEAWNSILGMPAPKIFTLQYKFILSTHHSEYIFKPLNCGDLSGPLYTSSPKTDLTFID
jgi:hypothetical protein